jgi:hypothetical protein
MGTTEAENRSSIGTRERRNGERIPAKLGLEVPLANWEQGKRVYSTNISRGGLSFSITGPASIPAVANLTLTLQDGQKVTFESEVRHVSQRGQGNEYEVGVQFRLSAEQQRGLDEALAKLGGK